jgi:hypothetical protein
MTPALPQYLLLGAGRFLQCRSMSTRSNIADNELSAEAGQVHPRAWGRRERITAVHDA